MRVISGEHYIEWNEAIMAGIPRGTLDAAQNRQSPSWHFITDPNDGRKILIHFDTLKNNYKQLIVAKFGHPSEQLNNTAIKQHLKIDNEAFKYYSNYKLSDGTGLSSEHINKYCIGAEWLTMLAEADKVKGFKGIYGMTRKQFYQSVLGIIEKENICLPASYAKLKKKLRNREGCPYEILISKKFCNNNSTKLGELQKTYLRRLYMNPDSSQKLMFSQITFLFNQTAVQKGWEVVTEMSVRSYLNEPSVQLLCAQSRFGNTVKGKHDYFDTIPVINRSKPSYADDMWVLDGTPFELYYMENGKTGRFSVYMVVDACSSKVIGWDICKSETKEAIEAALRMACVSNHCKPHQLQSDNSAPNQASAEMFRAVTPKYTPTKVGNARSKVIEAIGKLINEQILKWYPNYAGANITAKKADNHPNRQFLTAHGKSIIPGKEEVRGQIEEAFMLWNARKNGTGKSPNEKYAEGSPRKIELEFTELLKLFGIYRNKPITYTNEGITLYINGKETHYHVEGDVDFYYHHWNEKFKVKYYPDDISIIALYQDERFVEFATTKDLVEMALVDRTDKGSASYAKMVKLQDDLQDKIEQQLTRDEELMEAEGLMKLHISANHRYKDTANEAAGKLKELEIGGWTKPRYVISEEDTVEIYKNDGFIEGEKIDFD